MTTRTTAGAARRPVLPRATIGTVLSVLLVAVIAACAGGPSATTAPAGSGLGDISPSVEPFRTATPAPSRSPSEDPEGALAELLPVGGKCTSATDTVERGAVTRIKCTYSKLAQTVWLSEYVNADELDAAYRELATRSKTAGKGCEAARFHGVYSMGGKRHGSLSCLTRNKDAWMVWTIDERLVLGEVTRKGNKSKVLYQWWAKSKPVGAKTALKLTKTDPPPAESAEPSSSDG